MIQVESTEKFRQGVVSPGRKREHSAPVPWNLAIRIAGSRERLCAGIPKKTWQGWETAGEVPAYRVMPILLRRVETGDLPAPPLPGPESVTDLVELLHPDAAMEPLAGLPRGYMERYRERVKDVERRLGAYAKDLQRELMEFRALLLSEHRGRRG